MKKSANGRETLYATDGDFCRIFKDDMQSLYLLALVLTAAPEKAEQCFVAGLDDCASGNKVFKAWARSWARRVVITNAIRSFAPGLSQETIAQLPNDANIAESAAMPDGFHLSPEISALLLLPAKERFAFVMSFCEGYSDHDSALLLGCTRETLVAARLRALEQLKDAASTSNILQAGVVLAAKDGRPNAIELAQRWATVA